jgi:hypothetical protein
MRLATALVAPALALALGLGGCAQTIPGVDRTTPSVSATPGSATASAPVTAAVSPSPSPSPSPSATAIVLAADAIGELPFGTAQATVASLLTERLGKPSDTASGRSCELDSSSPWVETLVFKNLWVEFQTKDAKKTSPRTLHGWGLQLNGALPSALAIADDVPLDLSFKQLKAKYPGTKTLDLGLEDGTIAVQLPNKLIFYGVKEPEVLRGGAIGVCE